MNPLLTTLAVIVGQTDAAFQVLAQFWSPAALDAFSNGLAQFSPVFAQSGADVGRGLTDMMATGQFWVFVILAPISVVSALAVVFMDNPIHAALMLIVNFLTIAGLYLALNAQFLGLVQITVYAGAVVILFLFVFMLIGVSAKTKAEQTTKKEFLAGGLAAGGVFVLLIASFVQPWLGYKAICTITGPSAIQTCVGNYASSGETLHTLAVTLFTGYFWPFEITSVLLMVAAIGAMVIGRHQDRLEELVEVGYGVPPGYNLPDYEDQELLRTLDLDDDDDDDFDDDDLDESDASSTEETPQDNNEKGDNS